MTYILGGVLTIALSGVMVFKMVRMSKLQQVK